MTLVMIVNFIYFNYFAKTLQIYNEIVYII